MKKAHLLIIGILISGFIKSQCTPPSTFAVGPFFLPCGSTAIISAGTNSASVTYSYSWSSPPFASMSCPTGTACYNNMVNTAGIYTVVILDVSTGCFSTNTVNVIQGGLSVSISGNDTICSGGTAYIWATTFPSVPNYTWSTGSNLSAISVSPTVTTVYTFTASHPVYGCTGTSSFTVNVVTCLGIKSFVTDANIKISPNPSNGVFTLKLDMIKPDVELRMINVNGEEVFRQAIKQGKNEIDASGLAKGIYHYVITRNKEPISKGKIVIE